MAETAISDPEMMQEIYDSEEELARKVEILAEMVRRSSHFVAFTGAGISTSAGIPDFRGPTGKWTRQAQGLEPLKGVSIVDAYPTSTHMALLELYNRDILKYVISQNCDGLHRRSGLPAHAISELHGNCWVEICEDCGQQHFRDYKCMRLTKPGGVKNPTDHFTGRFCGCGGRLLNSTIDFGQSLPQKPLERAERHSQQADLHLACGSSLRVSPACDQPANTAAVGGNLVIVNLQKTPLTSLAALHIYAPTDVVMNMLMQRLDIPIPKFALLRRLIVGKSQTERCVYVKPVDPHDPTLEVDYLRAVDWLGDGKPQQSRQVSINQINEGCMSPKLHFTGHYGEPPMSVDIDLSNRPIADIQLSFDPYKASWTVVSSSTHDVYPAALEEAIEARIPDYGPSQRQYCIDMYMKSKKCSVREASEAIDKRFENAKTEALAAQRRSRPVARSTSQCR